MVFGNLFRKRQSSGIAHGEKIERNLAKKEEAR